MAVTGEALSSRLSSKINVRSSTIFAGLMSYWLLGDRFSLVLSISWIWLALKTPDFRLWGVTNSEF